MEKLKQQCQSIFWLETCQRLIIAITGNTDQIEELILTSKLFPPERFSGVEGVHHLLEVVSSFDSIVVGEDQILHQFKVAYKESEQFMDRILKRLIQGVIRAGKRIRSQTIFGKSRKSTISVVIDHFKEELSHAQRVSIIGSGQMAKIIIDSLKEFPFAISVFSRTESRINMKVGGLKVNPFSNLIPSDIIFVASKPGSPKLKLKDFENLDPDCCIFDFGMPRQTSSDLESHFVKLFTLEDLLQLSRKNKEDTGLGDIRTILDKEANKIMREIRRLETAHIWDELRRSLRSLAIREKDLFLNDSPEAELKFQKFVNKIIHVTQKKVEEVFIDQ